MSHTLCPFILSSLFLNFHEVSFMIGVGFELPRVKIKDFTMKRQILSVYSYLNANAKVKMVFNVFVNYQDLTGLTNIKCTNFFYL